MFAARHLFSEQITVCIAFPSPSTPSAGHPGHINIRNYAPNTTVFFHLCRALARGRICPSDNFLFDRSTAGCPQSAPSQSLSLSEVVSSGIGRRRRQEGLHRAAHDAWPASEMHGCLGLLKQGCISSAGQHQRTECQPPAMYGTTTGFRNLYRTLQWLPPAAGERVSASTVNSSSRLSLWFHGQDGDTIVTHRIQDTRCLAGDNPGFSPKHGGSRSATGLLQLFDSHEFPAYRGGG